MKTAQLKDKRREWEASPDFMKNTMAYDKDDTLVALRKDGTVREKIDHATPAKARGNELYAEGLYEDAMSEYTKAIAVFRYWNRETVGNEQNLVCFKDDETTTPTDPAARAFVSSVLLNASACMAKIDAARDPDTPPTHVDGIVWTCTEVLNIDDACVKAYYRRAIALASAGSSVALEKAVKDLARAARLAPSDALVRDALRKHRSEYDTQCAKDRKTYGGAFKTKDGLYTKEDEESMCAAAEAKCKEIDAMREMSDDEIKARARARGIDLDDAKVRKQFEDRARARHDAEMAAKAREFGIDLSDPDVKKMLALMEKENAARMEGFDVDAKLPAWRRWLYLAFDKNNTFSVQNFLYVLIAVRAPARAFRFVSIVLRAFAFVS